MSTPISDLEANALSNATAKATRARLELAVSPTRLDALYWLVPGLATIVLGDTLGDRWGLRLEVVWLVAGLVTGGCALLLRVARLERQVRALIEVSRDRAGERALD